jgi:hypothetical protein
VDKGWVNCGMVGVPPGVLLLSHRDTGTYRTRT